MPKNPNAPFSRADSFARTPIRAYDLTPRPDQARRAGKNAAHARRLKQIEARLRAEEQRRG
jgi:poly-gamma-glutamate capsule biosynthesis protein CapA/YwtB (metallophosphatase superfamily)